MNKITNDIIVIYTTEEIEIVLIPILRVHIKV